MESNASSKMDVEMSQKSGAPPEEMQSSDGFSHDRLSESPPTSYDSIDPTSAAPAPATATALSDESSNKLRAPENNHDFLETVAGMAGNILEWYDFAVFGFFGDIIGDVFFPPQAGHLQTVESFAVFGMAFIMRPFGGLLLGYIGDKYGRKRALVISIFMMAFPTFAMGCLPSYDQVGPVAIVLLVLTRLMQGMSVGGQFMSSLVFTLEGRDPGLWGFYGSFVMVATNIGNLSGNLVGFIIQQSMNQEQLIAYGWRIPFLCGIIVSLPGFYLHWSGSEDHSGQQFPAKKTSAKTTDESVSRGGEPETFEDEGEDVSPSPINPLVVAFAMENRRSLAAACLVPVLWAAGGYLTFVWMAIYMKDLSPNPIKLSFGINAFSLLFSICLFFPVAGLISDRLGRIRIMTLGGIAVGVLSPFTVWAIGQGNPWYALGAQITMGVTLSLWGSPMLAWLVESFEPEARLTSVAIGYNVAQAVAGGSAPALATLLVDKVGVYAPGWMISVLSVISLVGLRCVAPPRNLAINTVPSKRFARLGTSTSSGMEMMDEDDFGPH